MNYDVAFLSYAHTIAIATMLDMQNLVSILPSNLLGKNILHTNIMYLKPSIDVKSHLFARKMRGGCVCRG